MADFFKNETKRRITAGIVTGVMAFSTVISNVAPALAETADTGTPTTAEAPANPAPAETPQPATAETETPATPTASTEESTPGAITPTEENSTVTAGTPAVAEPPAAPATTTEKWNYVFDTNGGSFADGSTTKTVTLDSDSQSVNAPATPSKPGMTFVGWADLSYTDSKGIKGVYTVDASQAQVTDTTDASGNVTHTRKLYAIYQIKLNITGETEQPVYRFDANGGHAAGGTNTIIEVPATSGTTDDNVPAPIVVRDGYDFVGWGKAATSDAMSNLGVTNVNFMSVIAGENPMTLERDHDGHVYHTVYAIWKQAATPAGTTTTNPVPANPATAPTSTNITFTQGNIPNVRDGVPTDKMAVQFVSDVSLNGTKFVGAPGTTVTAPSGLTDPDGRTVVKWVTDVNGSDSMAPGETREIDTLNGETFHAVWQPKDGNDDVQYRLVINANGGHFEGGIDVMNERHDFLPADMPNVKAATKMTHDGFTLAGFSHDKNGTVASARSLTEAMGIRDAEHIPGHTKDGALPGKTDEVYTLYAIWKDNSQARTDEYRYVFMGNGGHVADDENVIHSTVVRGNDSDVAAISAPAMVRDGYTFVGWGASNASTEAESLGVNSANFSGITASDSMDGTTDIHTRRVFAIWKQNTPATQHKNTYIFDANGGTITGSTDTTSTIANANPAEATNVAAPKAEKAGYTFVGWAKDPGASTTFVLGNDHVDFSNVGFTVENDTDGSVVHIYKVYAVYKLATTPTPTPTPDPGTNPVTPGTGEHVPTDGVPPTLEPVAGKNTIMFYSGKLNKGETSVTNTGEHADVVAPNREYSLADGTMVKRWISTDGTVILLPGGRYDADSIKDKVFVADYVTATPPDYDPTQNYPQNVSHIQLHFHANGGKGEHGETVYAISGDPSATDLPVRPTFTREGYTFKGWSRNGLDTEVNVIVNNNMVNLKSIGKRSEITDPQDPHKVIVVYNVYAVWQKDEVTPDNPVTPPTPDNPVNPVNPDTPGGHNGNITPGEPGGGTGTVTPDNPVTPGTDGDNYLGIPIHHTQGEPQYINTGNGGTTTQSDNAPQGHWVRKRVRRNALPNTGDAASATGIIAGIGAILASLGLSRKRKNQ